MYTRLARYLTICCFLLSLWAPLLIAVATPDQKISAAEKRQLASRPQLQWDTLSQFPDAFEAYYNDHFGLREELLFGYNYYQFALLNVSTSNRVIVGSDGWLFQNGGDHVRDMRNIWPFSPGELQHWANILTLKHQWLQQQGIDYLFVVTPSKHLIYPEKLPGAFAPVQPVSRADQLITYLKENTKVPVVDMRKALFKEKNKLRPYHKTDTHWNSYGAYIGYREMMQQIKKQLRGIPVVKLRRSSFDLVSQPGGDLAQSLNLHQQVQEEAPLPTAWNAACLHNHNLKGEANDTSRNQQWFTTTCPEGKYRAIMFRDSYSVAMMPYLSQSFASIYYIPHSPVRVQNMQQIVLENKPDLVIEQRASRWLRTPEG